MSIKRINCFIFTTLLIMSLPAQEFLFNNLEGSWASKDDCDYCIKNQDFSIIQNENNIKKFENEGLLFEYDINNNKIFGILGIASPWIINKITYFNSNTILNCNRISYLYNSEKNIVEESISEKEELIKIYFIDEYEIIFDYVSYPLGTHFYRISAPTHIPVKKAILNDSNVRLRVKPNLNCDTWAKLSKGTVVLIKDKSKEKYEIDGENWYWYYVDAENYPDGWVYGKYLDIEK